MKKIIYSLVIMIAASSLFTACIEQIEPNGIVNLRDAKAKYLENVGQLRLAEAEVQKAQATYWQALAAVEQANAAYRDAETEGQKLLNEMQALLNEAQEMENEAQAMDLEKKAAEIAAQIDAIRAAAELAAVQAQQALAEANEDLRVALAKIAADQLKLTDAEAAAVSGAIAKYEGALADYLKAVEALTDAEKAVWNHEYDMATWPMGDWYEYMIEYYTEQAEIYKEMADNVPEDADVEAWQAELKKYQDSLEEYKYNRYQVTKDSVDFMVNVYHDGVKAYEEAMKSAVKDWNKNNPEPKVVNEPVKPEKDINPVKLPKFVVDNADAALKIYSTYGDMLSDYKQVVPVGDTTKWGFEIIPGPGVTTIDINNVNYQLKDWILGKDQYEPITFTYKDKATDTDKTLSAHYGLKGALAILQRELVTAQAAQDTAAVKKAAADADSVWAAHRAILLAGLKDWQPYKDSVAKKAELKKAMDEAKAKYASGENSLIGAINTFGANIIKASTPGVYSQQDSATIFSAFKSFAAARKAYLDYEEEDPDKDLNYFHYGQNVSPGFEKVEFANLDFKGFQKTSSYTFGAYSLAQGTLSKWTGATDTHLAYAHVASQLFGGPMVPYVDDPVHNPYPTTIDGIITLMNGGGYTPFYGKYMLAKKTVGGKEVLVIKVVATGEEYVPSEVKDAEDAYNNYKGVEEAEKAFVDIYNSFWGTSATVLAGIVTPAGYISDEKSGYKDTKAGCYTEATFCEPYPIVNFNGAAIIYNDGLAGILQMIDPSGAKASVQAWKSGTTIQPSAIFGNNNTDFYKKLHAAYQLDLLMNGGSYQKALDAIAAWIEEIEKAFDKVVSDYEEALPKYEQYKKDKKAYDDAKKAAGLTPATIDAPVNYAVPQIKDGKWDLTGAALENAEKFLPGYPERLAEWKKAADKYNDQIYHLETLINTLDAAYIAAVKVYNTETTADTFKKYVEEYGKARADYYDDCMEDYYDALDAIEYYTKQLAQYEAGYDATQLAYEDALHALANAEQAVADALANLKIAEAEYIKVMAEYCPED